MRFKSKQRFNINLSVEMEAAPTLLDSCKHLEQSLRSNSPHFHFYLTLYNLQCYFQNKIPSNLKSFYSMIWYIHIAHFGCKVLWPSCVLCNRCLKMDLENISTNFSSPHKNLIFCVIKANLFLLWVMSYKRGESLAPLNFSMDCPFVI